MDETDAQAVKVMAASAAVVTGLVTFSGFATVWLVSIVLLAIVVFANVLALL